MVTTEQFEKSYGMLNDAQRQAVDAVEGPVMVVAGPGTGKTQILTVRIANILKQTDSEPENILALTFTEAAVTNMRKRLAQMIGSPAYQVRIATFHGFANDIIQTYPEYFSNIIGAASMTEVDQVSVLQDIIMDLELELLKPFGDTFLYVRPILSAINKLKQEGVTPDTFEDMVVKEQATFEAIDDLYHEKGAHKGKMKGTYQTLEKKINKNRELATVYRAYQSRIREDKKYDFTDMIMELVRVLQNDTELLLVLQEQYQYFLVDEHQDTNNAQNQLLELLANFHENPNLFVVGDEKQSIFRFQGASVENFFYFKDRYSAAQLITLTDNYRSTQSVLDSAESLLAGEEALQAQAGGAGSPIDVVTYPNKADEIQGVALQIRELIDQGTEPSEIAALYRTNRDAFALADACARYEIPFQIESDRDLYSDPLVKQIMTMLRAVASFGDDEQLALLLFSPFSNIDVYDATRIVRAAKQKRKFTLYDCLKDPKKQLKDIELYNSEALTALYANLESWIEHDQANTLVETVEYVLRTSGVINAVLGSATPTRDLAVLDTFFNQVKEFAQRPGEWSIKDFVAHIELMREHGMMTKQPQVHTQGAVRLMTAHRSKGLEFGHVFIVHAIDGHWGNRKKRDLLPLLDSVFVRGENISSEDSLQHDDERRLMYVALTRARNHVTLSYYETGDDGREAVRSQFIDEIDENLISFVEPSERIDSDLYKDTTPLFTREKSSSNTTVKENIKDFVRSVFFKQGLSVSALNNYLKDPWLYFFRNLVRLPSAPNKHQIYGIVVHDVLSHLFNARNLGQEWSRDMMLQKFEEKLAGYEYELDHDYADTLDKGHRSLTAWFDEYEKTLASNTLNEFRINGVLLDLPGGAQDEQIRLTGVLDKLEIQENGKDVVVVDYKTGKPKSRNDIMGNTKSSTGDYYRQLVFYKLLLNHFAEGKYNMIGGEIDFVEPDTKDKLHKEHFEITDEEVTELESLIQKISQEILDLAFWDHDPNPDVNEYTDLVDMIR